MGWRIDPIGLEQFLHRVHQTYRPRSIMVTENGASYSDSPDDTGLVNDQRRMKYLGDHIEAAVRARQSGVPVDGYFVWSFLDNLEWVQGFSQRFGLVWVDHRTGRRVPKESYRWYSRLVGSATLAGDA